MKGIFTSLLFFLLTSISLSGQTWVPLNSSEPGAPETEVSPMQNGGFHIEVSLSGFYYDSSVSGTYSSGRLLLEGGVEENKSGMPDMQHLTISLRLPDKGRTLVELVDSEYTDYPDFGVTPSSGDPANSKGTQQNLPARCDSVYNADSFFPGALLKAAKPYIFCDVRGQAIQVYPFQYNPVTRLLRVYHHLAFRMICLNEQGENEIDRYSVSYGQLSELQAVADKHFNNSPEAFRYNPVPEPGNMLILCPSGFMETMKPFAAWKAQTGIRCELVDVSTIGNSEAIRSFVSDYYFRKGLTYLLLAGDVAQIPPVQSDNGYGDNPYGYVSGNDHYPEFIVGRFPAQTAAQLRIMTDRSIAYEMLGKGGGSYAHFLGIGSESGPGDDGEMDFEHIRKIGNLLTGNGYTRFTEMYDGSQGGSDSPGNPTPSMIADAVNQGQGAIMYIGHGTVNSWSSSGFSITNIAALTNTDAQPLIWSAGCNSGDFNLSTCLAEAFLRAEYNGKPSGAVAAMMSTGIQSWYPPMEAQDEIALILSGQKASAGTRTFGGISMCACMKMNDKYGTGGYRVTDTWNIFGDPSVVVRTAEPKEISAHHGPVIGRDAREFSVSMTASEALVSITYNGTVLGAARAEEGLATILLPEIPETDSLLLTITAFNCLPYIASIAVSSEPATATNPFPSNNSFRVSAYPALEWETGDGTRPQSYEVFLTEASNPDWSTGTPVSDKKLVLSDPLHYNTTYLWKVVSANTYGRSESKTFTFTTGNPPDEDFENQGFPRSNWQNNSAEAWFIDSETFFEGHYSIRSGVIGNNDSSRLACQCYTTGCDLLGFRKKVSSESGSDKLSLKIDGRLMASWSGENDWSEEEFQIEPGEHLIEWIYTKNAANTSGRDAAWIDNIYLPEHSLAEVQTEDFSTCAAPEISVDAYIRNYARAIWESEGSGSFDDTTGTHVIYHPSADDFAAGFIRFNLKVFANNFCAPDVYPVQVELAELPIMPEIRDTLLYASESLHIDMPENSNSSYKLLPEGTQGSGFTIEASQLQPGLNQLTVHAENETGCTRQLTFTVTRIEGIRPVAGETISPFPNPASDRISFLPDAGGNEPLQISIYTMAGQVVYENNAPEPGTHSLDVSALNQGIYLLKINYGSTVSNGKFIKTL